MLRPIFSPMAVRAGTLAIVTLLGTVWLTSRADDVIILPDGFMIQGKAVKENNPFGYGFDVISDGPKIVVFSSHTKKGAKIEKDIVRPDYVAYRRQFPGTRGFRAPSFGEMKTTDFDENWRRVVKIKHSAGNYHEVKQMITFLDPYTCSVSSTSHNWRLAFHTKELEPDLVKRLINSHPELIEEEGKPDPVKRLAKATFFKDTGWLKMAQDELDQAREDIPGAWPPEQAEELEKLRQEIDLAETRLILNDLEAFLEAGRYRFVENFLQDYTPRAANQTENNRLAVIKAKVETVQPRYQEMLGLLGRLIRAQSGLSERDAHSAAASTAIWIGAPKGKENPKAEALLPAAMTIFHELHPDNAERIELFGNLAKQSEQRQAQGLEPSTKPEELFALAVTGWLKGKNGAEPNVRVAVQCWKTRTMATEYLANDSGNVRSGLLKDYMEDDPLEADELSQVISLLPPPFPEDITQPLGKEADPEEALVPGVFSRTAGRAGDGVEPVEYWLRLPPEYHHGRSYPLMIVLTHRSISPEQMVGLLSFYADKFGYAVAAPKWTNQFTGGYDWTGNEHRLVTAVHRDLLRRFQIDSDKVFLFGFGDGADFAMDVGCSHPDLFAGLVLMGPNSHPDIMMHYWSNTQKLPVYVATGEMAGSSAPNLRKVFEKWMPRGFPALMTMYRGRGIEWYSQEIPRIFDWMGRKTRARGTASLRLNSPTFEPWHIGRNSDNRFYWVGTNEVQPRHMMPFGMFSKGWVPAYIKADIRNGNEIVVNTRGLRDVTIWLERDMIDWSRPVKVILNGQNPIGYKPRVMEPDIAVMFEELYRMGDRKMLFMGRLDFPTP